ncbi:hypothetical protein RZS08_52625, partial [Arthrospira platensis SPKY1]|nr:hypothetical protein [Arthrospira platensis SPKY1]
YTTSDNIDIEECHKKFEYLIKKSLKDGFSFDFIKINTFYLDINNSINVLMISLRLEYNRILNFGLNIKFLEKILLDKYNYLNNLYLKILTLIPFNIIVIN